MIGTIRESLQPSQRLFRIGYVLALMLVCIWAAQSVSLLNVQYLGMIVIGFVFLMVSLRHLEFGMWMLVFTALFVSITLGTGTGTAIPASMILSGVLFGLWILSWFMRRGATFIPAPTNIPLLGFILTAIIALPWSWLFYRPEQFIITAGSGTPFLTIQLAGLSLLVVLPLLLLLSLNIIHNSAWIRAIVYTIAFAGLGAMIFRFLGTSGSIQGVIGVNASGQFQMWVVSILYGQLLFNKGLPNWQRIMFVAIIVGWIIITLGLGIGWISGWGPIVASVFLITFVRSRRAALAVIALGAVFVLLNFGYFWDKVWVQSVKEDFNRFEIWPTIIGLVVNHASPILGAGPVGYTPLYRTYISADDWSAHNNYVDIFAQTGLIGCFFFAWFMIAAFRTGWRARNAIPDPFLQGVSNGMLGAIAGIAVAMFLGDWFIPFVYNVGFAGFNTNVIGWTLIGVMIRLAVTYTGTRAERESVAAMSSFEASNAPSPG